MLVIRRKAGESIVIGGEIEIEVIEVSGSRVKLGIRAPRQTLILRKELLATGQENQRAALSLGHAGLASLLDSLALRTPPESHPPIG
ncbi:MAG: carbon storage regulator [Bryobacteraceae bacterium]